MSNLKKSKHEKLSFRRTIVLKDDVARRVQELAEIEQRSVAAMLRLLVEKSLTAPKPN